MSARKARRKIQAKGKPRRTAAQAATSAAANPGVAPVLTALAASAAGVRIDLATLRTTPKNLLGMRFGDRRIGLSTPAQIEAWRGNLVQLVPHAAERIATLQVTPATTVADAAQLVGQILVRAARQATGPTVLAIGAVGEARKKVEDKWGKAFASKSSAALLRRLTAPVREVFAAAAAAAPALILEFADQQAPALDAVRAASRTQRLASLRDAFYKAVSPIRVAIEKNAGASGVQMCWLNSTMRVGGQVAAVANVADHQALQLLDLSRSLRREMNVAGLTVHAAQTRTTLGLSGTHVRVAVIDGEVNVNHPALSGRVTLQENFTSEPFGTPDGHGTAVAGIIAAIDATFGGIAPAATILNYKVFPTGSSEGDEFQGILAVEHALRDGADIANCSWGIGPAGDGTSREAKAFNTAWQQGLVLVKSAGNEGPGPDTMTSPADADGVVVVGATEREVTTVQDYSSRGPTSNNRRPHVVAPGGSDAFHITTCLAGSGGGFGDASFGTSLAAPVVSGAAALLRERFPSATPDEIRERLIAMCQPLAAGDVNASGAGLLDLARFNPA